MLTALLTLALLPAHAGNGCATGKPDPTMGKDRMHFTHWVPSHDEEGGKTPSDDPMATLRLVTEGLDWSYRFQANAAVILKNAFKCGTSMAQASP